MITAEFYGGPNDGLVIAWQHLVNDFKFPMFNPAALANETANYFTVYYKLRYDEKGINPVLNDSGHYRYDFFGLT